MIKRKLLTCHLLVIAKFPRDHLGRRENFKEKGDYENGDEMVKYMLLGKFMLKMVYGG
jgi:hypothetical protein